VGQHDTAVGWEVLDTLAMGIEASIFVQQEEIAAVAAFNSICQNNMSAVAEANVNAHIAYA